MFVTSCQSLLDKLTDPKHQNRTEQNRSSKAVCLCESDSTELVLLYLNSGPRYDIIYVTAALIHHRYVPTDPVTNIWPTLWFQVDEHKL